jgi:peptidoglycan pentaglycine glycine transferase (the first glycine)
MNVRVVQAPSREAWNKFVSSQTGSSVYQSYEWGEIRRTQAWTPHYVALESGLGEWLAASLVLSKHLPGGVGALLYSPRGPVVAPSATGAVAALIEAVRDVARRVGGIFWRIEPPVLEDDPGASQPFEEAGFLPIPQEWSYWNRPKYEMQLSIDEGEAAIFSKIGTKIRTKIRHASKRGVVIDEGFGEQDIESFYRLLHQTGMKKRIPVRSLDYFRALYQSLVKGGMGRLFIARKDAGPVAAGLTSRFGSTASLLYLSNDYSTQRAGWAVQWEMIRWAIAEGCTVYDFGGTGTGYPPKHSDKGYGVYQFKQSFGAKIVTWYGYADYVYRPSLYAACRAVEHSLPYGERMLLEWPKRFVYRWQTRTKSMEPGATSSEAEKGAAGES